MPSAHVDKIIADNYKTSTYAEIASKVGKTRDYVRIRAQRLGLHLGSSELAQRRSTTMRKVLGMPSGSPLSLTSYQQKLRYYGNNPERKKCYYAYEHALRSGKLVRLPCEVCGNKKSEGHHESYSKPLDVKWLCRKHHYEEHKKLRNQIQ